MRLTTGILLTSLCLHGDGALAQTAPCLANQFRPVGAPRTILPPPDLQSSQTWLSLEQAANPSAMQQLVGVWYSENRNAQLNMVQQIYYSFDANGLFQYRDQTCSNPGIPCSQNAGTGSYRATFGGDGSTFFMIRFSDLSRESQCVSSTVRFANPQTMVSTTGQTWVRAQ